MQNIDKIAIALAVLILVAGFSISALMPDSGGKLSTAIDEANVTIEQRAAEQDLGARTAPSVEAEVRKAFSFQGETALPEWSFYRRPARLELFRTEVVLPPSLISARISTVSVVRDGDSNTTHHKISGRHAIFERAEIVSCTLEVRSDEGEWEKLQTVAVPASGGAFELVAGGLKPKSSYNYRVVTRGLSSSSIAFSNGSDLVTSDSSGAVLYPADAVWRVSGSQIGRLDTSGNLVPGRVTVQYSFWDWAATSTKRNTKIVTETPDGQSGPDLFETGFRLERIQDTADGRYAVLKDGAGKRIYLKNNDTPLPLDPSGWENLDPDPALTPEEGTEEEGAGEEVPATETKPDKPPKPRRSGGGLFGGDDR
ncbi:MAG: hypothetical protein HRU16_01545 [Planctomycetes bacterium]|nr:hypothetical protein [Planctomycetota bacterium]